MHADAPCYGERVRRAWLMALLLVGCRTESTPVPPFPIPVDLDTGPVLIGMSTADQDTDYSLAVVDTLSPLTVIDDSVARGLPPGEPERRRTDLTLYGLDASGAVPQVGFSSVSIWDLHPCATVDAAGVAQPCTLGLDGQTRAIQSILGADLLARGAARFAFAEAEMFLLPDVAGSDQERADLCEAVFPAPFHGGGTMVVRGAEVSYSGRRIAVGACVYDDAAPEPTAGVCTAAGVDPARPDAGAGADAGPPDADASVAAPDTGGACGTPGLGLDGLFLVSTGLPVTVVSERFYRCYESFAGATPLADLPATTLHLPFGAMAVRMGEMQHLALVSETSENRGPCVERYANACMRAGNCDVEQICTDCDTTCRASAVAELSRPFPVAVMSDAEPFLQALRDELRPALPEIDGILAPSALTPLVVDVDYPHNRMLARCVRDECAVRPTLVWRSELEKDPEEGSSCSCDQVDCGD